MNEFDYVEMEELENEEDYFFDFFLAALKELSKRKKVLNVPRFEQMLITASKLKELLIMSGEYEKMKIDVIRGLNGGTITAEVDSFTVEEPFKFIELLKDVDNFEIYPLTNGKIAIGIAFNAIFEYIE